MIGTVQTGAKSSALEASSHRQSAMNEGDSVLSTLYYCPYGLNYESDQDKIALSRAKYTFRRTRSRATGLKLSV